jgi:hypothetical protein
LNELTASQTRVDRAVIGALRGRDLSGFEIWRWLGSEQGTIGLLTEADLYPTLYRLEAEHLLQGDWHEGERTRLTYRLTATALARAEEHGWPEIPYRGGATPHAPANHLVAASQFSEPSPVRRLASPDPEAGSWFLPRMDEPAGVAESVAESRASIDDSTARRSRRSPGIPGRSRGQSAPLRGGAASDFPAVARYADELGAALDLPRIESDRVRQEIADHLTDSTRLLAQDGMDTAAAADCAIENLGEMRELAKRIAMAQQSAERRGQGIRRAVTEVIGEMLVWLAASAAALVLGPGLADIATAIGRFFGLHLVVLGSAQWATNQVAVMMCVGAFVAGRLSVGHLAWISRHSDASVRKPLAIGGAAAVLAFALLIPGYPDAPTVLTLLAVPVAFIAGTFRPKHQNEGAYTWRGLAAAALLVAVVTLLPATRLFAYDPAGTPNAPLAPDAGRASLAIFQYGDGTFGYEIAGTSTFVPVELWPATTSGLFVVVDRSAGPPVAGKVSGVDMAQLPPGSQWWVAAVVVGPDGQRTTQGVVIQTGASPKMSNALAWLIGHL